MLKDSELNAETQGFAHQFSSAIEFGTHGLPTHRSKSGGTLNIHGIRLGRRGIRAIVPRESNGSTGNRGRRRHSPSVLWPSAERKGPGVEARGGTAAHGRGKKDALSHALRIAVFRASIPFF